VDRLSAQWVGVVDQTMQPEAASLWLRPTGRDDTTPRRQTPSAGGSGAARPGSGMRPDVIGLPRNQH
jgi:hypothetical protein